MIRYIYIALATVAVIVGMWCVQGAFGSECAARPSFQLEVPHGKTTV